MLNDLDSPKTKAIFAAARELNALHRLWQASEFVSAEAVPHIGRLHSISVDQFHDSDFIRHWLNELEQSMEAKQHGDRNAEPRYKQAVDKLDSEEGFKTVFI